MSTISATKQLKISFDRQNTLRQNLDEGLFSVMLEYNPPPADQPFKLAITPGLEVARFVASEPRLVSLNVARAGGDPPAHRLLDVLGELRKACPKESIVFLSGAGTSEHALREDIAGLTSLGIRSLGAITGHALPDHPRDAKGQALPHPAGYLDSTRVIGLIRAAEPEAFIGARVNPFKYNLADAYLQYYKLLRKLKSGANFLLTQAGWDMKKYQELQWYLRSREIDEPVIARLLLPRADDVTKILDHALSGMTISREFAAQLQRDTADNDAKTLATSIRRLALQAAGCRLFGYSGIQLAGLHDARLAATAVTSVFAALEEFTNYEQWWTAWAELHPHLEMAPYPNRFYIYRNLMEKDVPDYQGEATPHAPDEIPDPPLGDRLAYSLTETLGLPRRYSLPARALKKLLTGATTDHPWQLAKTFNRAAAACPKGLEDGPCGGSWPNGTCEFGGQPCFYHRVLALAKWRKDLERFEEPDAH